MTERSQQTQLLAEVVAECSHTPGPWQFYADTPSVDPNWHIVTNASRMRVLANVHIEPGNAMDLANARLIAAAPELLAALKELLASSLAPYPPFEEGKIAQDAWSDRKAKARNDAAFLIAKAEGRL